MVINGKNYFIYSAFVFYLFSAIWFYDQHLKLSLFMLFLFSLYLLFTSRFLVVDLIKIIFVISSIVFLMLFHEENIIVGFYYSAFFLLVFLLSPLKRFAGEKLYSFWLFDVFVSFLLIYLLCDFYFFGDSFSSFRERPATATFLSMRRFFGPSTEPNQLAFSLLFLFLYLNHHFYLSLTQYFVRFLLFISFMLTFSVSAYFALAVYLLCFYIWGGVTNNFNISLKRKRIFWVCLFFLLLFFNLSFFNMIFEAIYTKLTFGGFSESNPRLAAYSGAISLFSNHPFFGSGFSSVANINGSSAISFFLNLLADGGLYFVFIFIVFFTIFLKGFFPTPYALAGIILVIYFLMISSVFYNPSVWLFLVTCQNKIGISYRYD